MITYTPFDSGRCWGLPAKSVALAERNGAGIVRQCTNRPASIATPDAALCYPHFLAHKAGHLNLHPDSPAYADAVAACPEPPCPACIAAGKGTPPA